MKNIQKILVASVIALLGLANAGCFRSTGSTEIGIKIGKLFGGDDVVDPGRTVMVIPVVHDWYVFDSKTQTLEMDNTDPNDELEFKTRDGNDIGVDVTVLYRVDRDKAPTLLRNVARDMDEVRHILVRPLARSIPRDALNELSSEEFYDSDLRSQKENLAQERLAKALEPYGLICERVVLGNYRFHDAYQKAIDDKKVADQEVNKNRSSAEAAVKAQERDLETEKGAVGKLIATETGMAQQVHLQADAYFEAKKLEAEAILAEKSANAKGVQKKKEAMSGSGGKTMVKLKIAEKLKGKRIILFPTSDGAMNIQRTDVNQFLETMGIDAVSKEPTRAAPATAPGGGN